MEVATLFKCFCNQKVYDTRAKLKQHQKTKIHLAWVDHEELREIKIELTRKDNEITRLNAENMFLRQYTEDLLRKNILSSLKSNKEKNTR